MTKDKLLQYFDDIAPHLDEWHAKNPYYYNDLEELCHFLIPDGAKVLEIGCGTGNLLHAICPTKGVGIDISPKMIDIARKKYPSNDFKVMDAENIELEDTYDVVILSNLIGYLPDIQHVLEEVQKVCTPETRIIVIYYNYLWEPILKVGERIGFKRPEPIQNWLSVEDISNLLFLSGFEVIKQGERLLFPKYFPGLSQFFNRYLAHLPILRRLSLTKFLVARSLLAGENKTREYSTSVVVAARNEKGNIQSMFDRIPRFGSSIELIVVEGHSTDDTFEEIKRVANDYEGPIQVKYMQQDGIGKADAIRKGFDAAENDILMILDADLTVPPEDLPKFYQAIVRNHGEFINGSRLVYPMEKQAMRILNIFGNKFFSLVFTWLLDQRFKDTLCGTKVLFKRDYEKIKANRKYFGDFDPFGDFDLIFGASKLNMKIVELPIRYRERQYGATNISRFRHGWLLLKMCVFAAKKIKFV